MEGTGKEVYGILLSKKRNLIAKGDIPDKKDQHSYPLENPPFEIPSNWFWAYLSDVSKIQEGPGIRKHQYSDEGVQFLTVTNILPDDLDLDKAVKYISEEEYEKKYSHFTINIGDIVTACSGATWGKSAMFDSDRLMILNTSTLRLRFFGDLSLNKYLYYLTKSEFFKNSISSYSTGQQPNYGYYHYSRAPIPIPPLPEQKQIVAILDQAFAAIDQAKANIEKNIENAKELFQSKLNEIFSQKGDGWEEKTLSDIGDVQTGTTPSTKDKTNFGDYIPFAKPPHFTENGSINTRDSKLSKKGLERGRLFKANSILMVCIGATIGKTGFSDTQISSNQQINALTPTEEYIPKLLYYALISPFVQNQVMSIGKSAQATLPIINKTKWSKLKVNLPIDKSTQSQLVETLQSLKEYCIQTELTYQQKVENLEELKKSILQKAFAGELTQGAVDEKLQMAAEPEEKYK